MKQERAKSVARRRAGVRQELPWMQPNVAGIDIGSREMYVCAPTADGQTEVRVFATTTEEIEACAQWLQELKIMSVAMESTGVYWIPVLELLESRGFATLLVDTRPLSRVPGRKTDVTDAEWIQTLHSHGLLQGCFRPTEEISQLRSLVRQKAVLVAEQADWVRRMQKCLDQMNVRVHQAVSDLQGVTGMRILRAIVGGERNPQQLAALRDDNCHKSEETIAALLKGHWRSDHLFNLAQGLKMYDALGERIGAYEREIETRMEELTPVERRGQPPPPLANAAKRKAMKRRRQEEKRQKLYGMAGIDLTTIDAVGTETAEAIISEYGIDLSRFPSEKQFVAHLHLAPRQAMSGGKPLHKRSVKTRGTRAGQALRNAATAAGKGATALGAYYRQIAARKGNSVAVFATARKIAIHIFRALRWGHDYVDIGEKAYNERYRVRRLRSLASTAAQFGYQLVEKNQPLTT